MLSKIASMVEAWADLQDIQDRVISCLRVLKGMPKQELIDGKIIAAGATYDFNAWHWALVARSEVLEKVKAESVKSKEQIKEIQSKIFLETTDLLEKETIRESDMRLENLKHRTQEIFFTITEPVLKQNLTKASEFLSIQDALQKQELEWEITFAACANDLDGWEYKSICSHMSPWKRSAQLCPDSLNTLLLTRIRMCLPRKWLFTPLV